MLTIQALINGRRIGMVRIHNTGQADRRGKYKYRAWAIDFPKRIVTVWHNRQNGWTELAIKVLKALRKKYDIWGR